MPPKGVDTRRLNVVITSDSKEFQDDTRRNMTAADKQGTKVAALSGKMAAYSEATDRAAKKVRELTDKWKAMPIEKQIAQIAALDQKVRKMKTHVGIDVEIKEDKKRSFGKLLDAVREQASGLPAMLGKTLSSGGPYIAAGIAAAIIAGSPIIGAALATALTAGPAAGLLAFGIKKAMDNPQVQKAFQPLLNTWTKLQAQFAKPFMQPLILAAKTFNQLLKDVGPSVAGLGKDLAPLVTDFAAGIADFVRGALPGFIEMIKAGIPLLKIVAQNMGLLGEAFGDFGHEVGQSGESTSVFIKDVLYALVGAVVAAGRTIRWLADRYVDLRNVIESVVLWLIKAWRWLSDAWTNTVNRLTAGVMKVRSLFDSLKTKVDTVIKGVRLAFSSGVSAIEKTWNRLQDITKKPINFFIDPVYSKTRAVWNAVTSKLGFGSQLPAIKTFATGGMVGRGKGSKDDQLSLLTRGEGVLTVAEIAKLGGPSGFAQFRQSLAQYDHGGMVGDGDGWLGNLAQKTKGLVLGAAASGVQKLVQPIRNLLKRLGGTGFGGVLQGGGNRALDALVSAVRGRDKQVGPMSGSSLWAVMRTLIGAKFPGLKMISGFRPGAHTLSGNLSYHALGRAVDYPAVRALAEWINRTFGSRTKELITPWQSLNLHNGKPHRYTGAVWNQHNFAGGNAHVHWAMDSASVVQPGWFAGYNGTGKPETLVNKDLIQPTVIENHYHIYNQGVGNMSDQDVKKLADSINKHANRNGGKAVPANRDIRWGKR